MTEEQRLAVETDGRALVVEAGAGTGKTAVLVNRFLYLLERHPDWPLDSIVAVTFTQKAAREMRSRIRLGVEEKAAQNPDNPSWQEHRRNLDRLLVQTIHGLCARLLRENAIAARVDPRFNVLEETDAGLLKEEALRQTLAEAAVSASGDAGLDLLACLRVKDLKEEMLSLLEKRGTVSRLFPEIGDTASLLARWQAGAREMIDELWRDALCQDPCLAEAVDTLPGIRIVDPADKLAEAVGLGQEGCGLVRRGALAEAWGLWARLNRSGGRQSAWGGPAALAELKAMLGVLQTVGKKMEKDGYTGTPAVDDEQAVLALQQWRALWDNVEATYDRLKAAQQSLDFDDLEIMTERLLCQQAADHRLAGFRDGIHHVMIDEFQDTNQIQQQIIYALAHPREPGRLFVVGDAKQSIYRFRQAQVSLFRSTAADIRQATGQPALPLSRSFRAHRALVAAQNHIFDHILRPRGASHKDYEAPPGALAAVRETPRRQDAAPAPVELWLLPAKDEEGANLAMEDARVWEARLLAGRLRALHEARYEVWDKGIKAYRAFRYTDAAILFRATTDLPLYEEQFKAEGMPYLTVSGRGYYDRPEIRDLAALLACLRAPADDLNLATVLRSPLFSLSDETLYRLRWRLPDGEAAPKPVPFSAALKAPPPCDQAGQVAFAAEVMSELWLLVGAVEVWELLQVAMDRTGYEAALALSDAGAGGGGRQRNNLQKFLSLARKHGGVSLSDFLLRVQDLREREAREGEALAGDPESGAVQLMSIHAAKGLEFPVVVVADLGRQARARVASPLVLHDPAFGIVCKQRDENGDWQQPPSYTWGKWLDERMDEAERNRLLYVACTRAGDLLILAGKYGKAGSWLEALQKAFEIDGDGEPDEVVGFQDFCLRVVRPSEQLPELRSDEAGHAVTPGITAMPALAAPLPPVRPWRPVAVTMLQRLVAAEDDQLVVRPSVSVEEVDGFSQPSPRYALGNIVHRALADWQCLDLPEDELRRRLAALARREGIVSPGALRHSVDLAAAIVRDVRRSPLFDEVSRASRRCSEVPFTWASPAGALQGVIDLLYQDAQGEWRLVDWKTGRLRPDLIQERAAKHRLQVAVYAMAAADLLCATPRCALCFVQAGAVMHVYDPGELTAAWQAALTTLGAAP